MMAPLTDRDYEDLTAFMDGEASPAERARVEARLATDADYRAELAALRVVSTVVAQLPQLRAPRSFALSPAQVQTVPASPRRLRRLSPLWSAVAGFAVVFVGVALFTAVRTNPPTPDSEEIAQVATATTLLENTAARAMPESTQTPALTLTSAPKTTAAQASPAPMQTTTPLPEAALMQASAAGLVMMPTELMDTLAFAAPMSAEEAVADNTAESAASADEPAITGNGMAADVVLAPAIADTPLSELRAVLAQIAAWSLLLILRALGA